MQVFLGTILALMTLLFSAGCTAPAAADVPAPVKEKLTIQDLQPTKGLYQQPQMLFNWVEFEIDRRLAGLLFVTPVPFARPPMSPKELTIYEQNGIFILIGKFSQNEELTNLLNQLGAIRQKRSLIMTMEKTSQFHKMHASAGKSAISYAVSESQTDEKTFTSGQFGIMLTAELTVRRDTVNLHLQPAFIPSVTLPYYPQDDAERTHTQALPLGTISMAMAEGDFMVFAPNSLGPQADFGRMLFEAGAKQDKSRLYVLVFSTSTNTTP